MSLLTIVGAIVISLLVARVVGMGLAVGGWLVGTRIRRVDVTGEAAGSSKARSGCADFRLDTGAPNGDDLLARQAWWRLKC